MEKKHLIIAGAEKAGTTSLYTYLAAHPHIVASLKKETDYFRTEHVDLTGYRAMFPAALSGARVLMESSPGYLAESRTVAPRIAAVLPAARLVLVLREPIDRLHSCFHFYKSRLHLPSSMTLGDYVAACFAFTQGEIPARQNGLLEWHLRALDRGRYDLHVPLFERHFRQDQLMVISYDSMRTDVRGTVQRVATLAAIDPSFFDTYRFERDNVSFHARNDTLQRASLVVNNRLERLWRSHPRLKQRLLRFYKRLNARPVVRERLDEATMRRLRTFYEPTYRFLDDRFGLH